MAQNKEVKLYGMWASTYCTLVHNALKLKGVPYEYVEEDLADKSETLLRSNPVHKKVPVLVVDGKPVAESLVILEFVDESWPDPPLLPRDAYLRAKARFWTDFIYQKLNLAGYAVMISQGEAQEKAIAEFIDHLVTLEDGIGKDFSSDGQFIHGERPGILDLIIGSFSVGYRSVNDIAGMELLGQERTPILASAVTAFGDLECAKESAIPYDRLMERVLAMRKKILAIAT